MEIAVLVIYLFLFIAVMVKLVIDSEWWRTCWLKWKNRNKKWSDYLSESTYPFNAVHQDVMDYQLTHTLEWRSHYREWFADRRLVVNQVARRMEKDIRRRYIKPLDYAYKRAGRLLLMSPNQRRYLGIDEETEALIREVQENYPIKCLSCGDTGRAWDYDRAIRCEGICACQKKKVVNIL